MTITGQFTPSTPSIEDVLSINGVEPVFPFTSNETQYIGMTVQTAVRSVQIFDYAKQCSYDLDDALNGWQASIVRADGFEKRIRELEGKAEETINAAEEADEVNIKSDKELRKELRRNMFEKIGKTAVDIGKLGSMFAVGYFVGDNF
jgi:hypothetical protein